MVIVNRHQKLGMRKRFNLECVSVVYALVVVKVPVSGGDRVCAEYPPSHDDVGGGHVVHVEADQGEVVYVARDGELSVQDDVSLHRLNIGLRELCLSFNN